MTVPEQGDHKGLHITITPVPMAVLDRGVGGTAKQASSCESNTAGGHVCYEASTAGRFGDEIIQELTF